LHFPFSFFFRLLLSCGDTGGSPLLSFSFSLYLPVRRLKLASALFSRVFCLNFFQENPFGHFVLSCTPSSPDCPLWRETFCLLFPMFFYYPLFWKQIYGRPFSASFFPSTPERMENLVPTHVFLPSAPPFYKFPGTHPPFFPTSPQFPALTPLPRNPHPLFSFFCQRIFGLISPFPRLSPPLNWPFFVCSPLLKQLQLTALSFPRPICLVFVLQGRSLYPFSARPPDITNFFAPTSIFPTSGPFRILSNFPFNLSPWLGRLLSTSVVSTLNRFLDEYPPLSPSFS